MLILLLLLKWSIGVQVTKFIFEKIMLNSDANDNVSKSFTFSIFNLFEQLLVIIEKRLTLKKLCLW